MIPLDYVSHPNQKRYIEFLAKKQSDGNIEKIDTEPFYRDTTAHSILVVANKINELIDIINAMREEK